MQSNKDLFKYTYIFEYSFFDLIRDGITCYYMQLMERKKKKEINDIDKKRWKAEQRTLYNYKIEIIQPETQTHIQSPVPILVKKETHKRKTNQNKTERYGAQLSHSRLIQKPKEKNKPFGEKQKKMKRKTNNPEEQRKV